jgi:hypothetical protein
MAKELAANPHLAKSTYLVPKPDADNPLRPPRDGNKEMGPLGPRGRAGV